ncbi:hypothetical protein [Proteiniphilum acetatigenes]|uniref:hypothetical protein n=1 Tax=Proteiniphilum acetatigenes TaxID=294710 RepID=UPI000361531F|nr:hypothetical protein [Proteiniphilum acetatigenes]SFL42741.1 hypothetical protein SAMN05216357_12247 [Porphyromonadaceae bacterium KH3CP3RA]
MTQEQEKQLLEAIYDRLFDAVTYQPQGGKNPFTEDETFIHFSKNAAVDVKSFANPRTPSNPLGDQKTSEEFARMVDQISPLTLEWENSNSPLSETFANIVNSANANTQPDEKAKDMYEKAYNYLHPVIKEVNPFTGEETTSVTDSQDYITYQKNIDDYVNATGKYRDEYNKYLAKLEKGKKNADREWQASEPKLANDIKRALQNITAGNGKYVEQALQIMETTVNDGIRVALTKAQEAVKDDRWIASSLGLVNKWLFSYPSPANWTDDKNLNFTELEISGGNTKQRSKSTEHRFGVDTTVNYGLWRVRASAEGNFEHKNSSTDTDSLSISCKIAKVNIMRPWFNESLFRLPSWSTNLVKTKGGISNGKIDTSNKAGYLPMYPVAFIIAKDIKIRAEFSHEDAEFIKQAVTGRASVGFGPFSIGGSYGYGKTEEKLNSDFQNGTIKVPGMQIIAWVSRVVPFSPQEV